MSNAKMQENNIIAKFGNQYGFTSETNTVKMVSELCFRYFAPTKRSLYLLVSKSIELGLDPFRGEIYPTLHTDENTGQMVPGVDIGYEGWMKVAKRDASYRGVTFNYSDETIEVPAPAGVPLSAHAWVEATIHLHEAEDVVVREYFDECYSPTSEAWNNKPKRYHRMVAYSQAVRLAINTDEQGERLFLNEDLDFEFESDNQRPPEAATVQPVVTQGEPNIKAVDSQPAKAQAEADAQVQAQAEAEADAKAQAEADAQVQAQAEAEADAKAQAEADAKAQAEAEAEAEAKAKAEAEAEAEAKAKAEAEAEAEAEAKAKAEAEAEA
ncbi:recombinase RecT, partial [Photobacterium lutimaris]